jgi:Zn-dependent protease with chaperone function
MKDLVHPKERVYFGICLALSVMSYLLLVISLIGLVYIMIGVPIALFVHGLFMGRVRGNGVRVSATQFPEVHRLAWQLAKEMELQPLPAIYVLQAGGLLNAFATRFLGRSFVVIYSDVLELAYAQGEAELAFVLCHEFAHIKRGHLKWRWALYPAMLVPFLGSAYSRACEYTCDRFGAGYRPAGAAGGLLSLAAGTTLYRRVNADEYGLQAEHDRGFWVWLAEITSSHPMLPSRVRAVTLSPVPVPRPAEAALPASG